MARRNEPGARAGSTTGRRRLKLWASAMGHVCRDGASRVGSRNRNARIQRWRSHFPPVSIVLDGNCVVCRKAESPRIAVLMDELDSVYEVVSFSVYISSGAL